MDFDRINLGARFITNHYAGTHTLELRIYIIRITNIKRQELITRVFTNRTRRDAVQLGIDIDPPPGYDTSSMPEMVVTCRKTAAG